MSNLIEISGLTRTYQVGSVSVSALSGVNLLIPRGSFVAITGPSGSGKSTLLHLLGCLDQPSNGSYTLDGVAIDGLDPRGLAAVRRHKIGFVFQQFHLLPRLNALENVELALVYRGWSAGTARQARAKHVLEQVGLVEYSAHRPGELSGGQQQRVAIARALVGNPLLILADEPSGSLDSYATAEILALFEQLYMAGHTVVVVTHEPDVAHCAERIVTMRDGQVASDGLSG